MPIGVNAYSPYQNLTMSLNARANRAAQAYRPELDTQRLMSETDKQLALNAIALAKQKSTVTAGMEKSLFDYDTNMQNFTRKNTANLTNWQRDATRAANYNQLVYEGDRAFRQMRMENAFGAYKMQAESSTANVQRANQVIGNVIGSAASLYQGYKQNQYNQKLMDLYNSLYGGA